MFDGFDPYTCMLEDNRCATPAIGALPSARIMLGSARQREDRHLRLTRVLSVKPGSPAERVGLRAGDRIYRVVRGVTAAEVHKLRVDSSGLPDEKEPFQNLPLDEAIVQFSGALGTTLGLNIFRDGWLLSRWVHLTHEAPGLKP